MVVPSFILYYNSRRSAADLETALSVAQQKRREDALRMMRLAETAPEQLTRAEKAVVEGKIAWRESVSNWRTSRTRSGSPAGSWSEGSGIKLEHLSKASTSSSGHRVMPDLEMAIPRPGSEAYGHPSTLPASVSVPGPAHSNTQKRQNAYDSLVGQRYPAVQELGSSALTATVARTTGGANVSSHSEDHGSTSTTTAAADRPTIVTDHRGFQDQIEGVPQDNLSTRSPITQRTPTKLYGFHLPRPQAGQAYAMQPDGEKQHGIAKDVATPLPGRSSPRPPPPPLHSLEVSSSEPVQLALRSPTRDANGKVLSRPAIVKHVSAPLTRRSAHIRRSTSASPMTISQPETSTVSKKPRSRANSLSSSRALRALQEDIAAVGPSWHRERMNKMSVSVEDLHNMRESKVE
jgi:hypothetical protein